MSRGSEGSLKTVRKGDGGGGWKASPDLTVSLPTVRETVITPFLQLLSHLPWPIEWSLPDSLPTAQDGGRGVDGSGPATLINHCHSVLFIFVLSLFLLLFSLLLASPLGKIRVLTWFKTSSHLSSAYHHILLCFLVLFLFLW